MATTAGGSTASATLLSADEILCRRHLVHRFSEDALSGLPGPTVIRRAVEAIIEGLHADAATFIDIDERRQHVLCAQGFETAPHAGQAVRWPFISAVVAKKGAIVVEDHATDTRVTADPFLAGEQIGASIGMPVFDGGEVTGVLSVHYHAPRTIDADDVVHLALYANILSLVRRQMRVESALAQSDEQRRVLLSTLVGAQEAERRQIAADIHDDAIQVMTATSLRLQSLRRRLVDEKQLDVALKLEQSLTTSIGRLRSLLFDLDPPALQIEGLCAAVRMHLDQHSTDDPFTAVLECSVPTIPENPDTRTTAYRIIQEALANVRKHAHAARVVVSIAAHDGGCLIAIADNGVGLPPGGAARQVGHLGADSMRHRAEVSGGWFRIDGPPGAGTRVQFWLPDRAAT
jgi:signal transduction histidine kinase